MMHIEREAMQIIPLLKAGAVFLKKHNIEQTNVGTLVYLDSEGGLRVCALGAIMGHLKGHKFMEDIALGCASEPLPDIPGEEGLVEWNGIPMTVRKFIVGMNDGILDMRTHSIYDIIDQLELALFTEKL